MQAGSPLAAANAGLAFADALLRALVAGGVGDLCLCPGSRSAPLAAAAVEVPGLRRFVHVDERAAGFFALGLARARRAPVALLCTSGTAALGFAPAVAEAARSRVPLVVLTADRPPELRGWGAAQTIDQLRLYGDHVRFFADAPPPDDAAPRLAFARALGARAVHEAWRPEAPGPVHLNLPFREPLDPEPRPLPVVDRPGALAPVRTSARPDVSAPAARLASLVGVARRGLVVCGPDDPDPDLAEGLARFARRAGWPVLPETASQLRFGPHTANAPFLAAGEALFACPAFAARSAPDLVLRIGAAPGGRRLAGLADANRQARVVAVDPAGGYRDPSHRVDEWLEAPAGALLHAAAERIAPGPCAGDPDWLPRFLSAEKRAAETLDARLASAGPMTGLRAARILFDALPPGAALFLSNSMPVRDADAALAVSGKPIRVFANRGANGIDGVISSALGASVAAQPLALLIGDLAFLHDLSGLFAARRHGLRATLVAVNDGGGSIFERLPIAASGPRVAFDEIFRCAHDVRLAPLAEAWGCSAVVASDGPSLERAIRDSLGRDGVHLIEVPVAPGVGEAERLALAAEIASALERP